MGQPKISKSCNECKVRKVKCETLAGGTSACNNCKKRNIPCHFTPKKKREKLSGAHTSDAWSDVVSPLNVGTSCSISLAPEQFPTGACAQTLPFSVPKTASVTPGKLFVDYLLESGTEAGRRRNESSILKAHENHVGSSNIAFFSDKRIASISERLGHTKFQAIFTKLNESVNARMNWEVRSKGRLTSSSNPPASYPIEVETVKRYIATYFEHVHPIYPFLQRPEFEKQALDIRCSELCKENAPFSALYHTVLALGCQRQGGEFFQRNCSPSWELFHVAWGLFPEIITSKETLVHVQAITAMAVFARNTSYVQIEKALTVEGARIAQSIGINRAIYAEGEMDLCQRAFWVVYLLEKTQTFACGRDSILVDSNIGTPIPQIPEAVFGSFDYFRAMCCFSRVLSKANDSLFSITATLVPSVTIMAIIDSLNGELERWKESIGEDFRPGTVLQQPGSLNTLSVAVKIRLSYHYYSAAIALARLKLSVASRETNTSKLPCEQILLHASRSIVELTRYIDVETYTPIWYLLSVPLSAIFILFDFVIHNPRHPETTTNISLLGIAAGYFCRLELSSGGWFPTSLLSDLAHIARDYISGLETRATEEPMVFSSTVYSRQPDENEAMTQPELPPPSGEESLAAAHDPLQGGTSNEPFYFPTDGDFFTMDGKFSEGVDLTSLFAAELPDFLDPSTVNLS